VSHHFSKIGTEDPGTCYIQYYQLDEGGTTERETGTGRFSMKKNKRKGGGKRSVGGNTLFIPRDLATERGKVSRQVRGGFTKMRKYQVIRPGKSQTSSVESGRSGNESVKEPRPERFRMDPVRGTQWRVFLK